MSTATNTTSVASAKEQFDRQAEQYNQRWASWTDETLQKMLAFADPQPDWRVLDVATGTGFTAFAFAKYAAHVTGADLSPGMLAQAAKRAAEQSVTNVDWVEAPAESLPFADASFDLVTVRIAPHHFTDVRAFLSEVRRVLKSDGVFVLGDTTVPDDDPEAAEWQNTVERERDPSHMRNLSPNDWQQLCEAAGFKLTNLDHATGAITIALSPWLETAGATGERAERVRGLFANAPESARRQFCITTDAAGETHFSWQRVVLRAVKGT
jgi:ubiquinone/menaquinone biosynthesis C-methylase UbiE